MITNCGPQAQHSCGTTKRRNSNGKEEEEVDSERDQTSRRSDAKSEGSGDVGGGVCRQPAEGYFDCDEASDQFGEDAEKAPSEEEGLVQVTMPWSRVLQGISCLGVSYGNGFCLAR